MAPWWDIGGAERPTAEIFHKSQEVLDKVEDGLETFRRVLEEIPRNRIRETKVHVVPIERVIEETEAFSDSVWDWANEMRYFIVELTRRECLRLGPETSACAGALPDPGKELRDRGVQTEEEGERGLPGEERMMVVVESAEETEVPVGETPMPEDLAARIEDMSSRLAANSDRLGLLEGRLRQIEEGRTGVIRETLMRAEEKRGSGSSGEEGVGEWAGVVVRRRKGVKRKLGWGNGGEGGKGKREGERRRRRVADAGDKGGDGDKATVANVMGAERCYRCLWPGHTWRRCTSEVDRGGRCYRCGSPGHKKVGCLFGRRCPLCVDFNRPARHRLGGPGCLSAPPAEERGGPGRGPRGLAPALSPGGSSRGGRGRTPSLLGEGGRGETRGANA